MSDVTSARIFDGVLGIIDLLGMKRWRARTAAPLHGTVLEIGAGSGRNAPWLGPGASVIALDPDFELLQLQRSRGRLRGPAVVAMGEALPFKDRAFDSAHPSRRRLRRPTQRPHENLFFDVVDSRVEDRLPQKDKNCDHASDADPNGLFLRSVGLPSPSSTSLSR